MRSLLVGFGTLVLLALGSSLLVTGSQPPKTRAGVSIAHFVPPHFLREGESIDTLTANYRLVGPEADVQRAIAEFDTIQTAFRELYKRARYDTRIEDMRATVGVDVSTGPADGGEPDSTCTEIVYNAAGTRRQQWMASDYAGIDIELRVGITRETLHIHMGSPEWAYSKIVQTVLQQKGFDLTVMHVFLDLVTTTESVAILQRVPTTALYAEETVLALRAAPGHHGGLQPFDNRKQNLLLKVMDSLGFHSSAGVSRVNITAVRHLCRFEPGRGHIGTVEVSLVTQRDKPHTLFAEALQTARSKLMDGFAEEGLPLASAEILSSIAAEEYSLQSQPEKLRDSCCVALDHVTCDLLRPRIARLQIAARLAPDDPVREYETRLPAKQLPSFKTGRRSLPQQLWEAAGLHSVTALLVTASVVAVATVVLSRQRSPAREKSLQPATIDVGWKRQPSADSLQPKSPKTPAAASRASLESGGAEPQPLPPSRTVLDCCEPTTQSPMLPSPFLDASRAPFRSNSSSAWDVPCLLPQAKDEPSRQPSGMSTLTSNASNESDRILSADEMRRKRSFNKVDSIQGWIIREEEIQICKQHGQDWLLGSGGYGRVYRGLRDGLQDVACKVLNNSDELQEQQFAFEIKLQKSLSFDTNIVHFLGVTRHRGQLMLVLEYMEGGSLSVALHRPGSQLGWRRQGRHLALDIVRGLAYLHKHSVLHGDLKSQNVLLGRHAAYAKLSDVGLSRIVTSTMNSQSLNPDAIAGTFAFAAPELLLGLHCSAKADIFSLGVLLWEICTLEIPRRGNMRDIRVPEEGPLEIAELIDQCLAYEPKQRPSCQEIFECIKASNDADTSTD